MNRPGPDDAAMPSVHRPPVSEPSAGDTRELLAQRWVDLREMLIRQLHGFETGDLTLRADGEDVSQAAIADLKRSILEFDALISGSLR